ncbi:glycosyltransferase family 2 protein [Psychroflexus sp. ALD_RP9]|uniref:glycosyltransferase family 2 protein n=1 Tax=Psychroflexus sp. ALD_RP9 TaxID=2777186 RepID=UPI001A904E3D|nr:glycosyltransferase family 2 protein [Psychroflexus sp. ALD_RP9]QSS96710.1 glycosyltransferase family 2 protein [Psychroflexus sp. ALD_RP9]
MNANLPQTAVAILNWNGKNLLQRFLPSLTKYSKEASIYVIDNASTDDSILFLKENYPEVNIIKNKHNFGFAGGYNEGLKLIKEDYLILLNNDVEVTKNWIPPLIKLLQTQAKVAAVQPKLKDLNKPDYFEYAGAAGGFIDQLGYPFCRGRLFNELEKDKGQYNDTIEIFWASGACFAVKREIFMNLGGFDEDYFAHQEEIDLCWRFKNFGYKIMYTANSQVYHLGGGSLNAQNPKKTFLNFRNSLFNIIKNTPKRITRLIILRILIDSLAVIYFLFKLQLKHAFAVVEAYISFFKLYSNIKHKRREVFSSEQYFKVKSIVWHKFFCKISNFEELTSKKC